MIFDLIDCPYEKMYHAPTPTSEDSMRERGEELRIGAKALLCRSKGKFFLCVVPADRQLHSKKVKRVTGSSFSFASFQELNDLTGLEKGAVPPFGNLFGVPTYVDVTLFENEYIAFNAASLTMSVKMKGEDYKRLCEKYNFIVCDIAK